MAIKTLVIMIGGDIKLTIERVMGYCSIEDWEFFCSGLYDYFYNNDSISDEWDHFVNNNMDMARIANAMYRHYNDLIMQHVVNAVDQYGVRHPPDLGVELALVPDSNSDCVLLLVKVFELVTDRINDLDEFN